MSTLAAPEVEADAPPLAPPTFLPVPPPARRMTVAEFLALPDDGIERWLIRGELREGADVSRRGFRHSTSNADVVIALGMWLKSRPDVGGRIAAGDAAFKLSEDAATTVGIDVAYLSPELSARTAAESFLIDGPPTLAVEIFSPSDQIGDVMEKVQAYLAAGVKVVWIVEPIFKTVTVYRPDAPPRLFNVDDELTAEPHLPGFKARVGELFGG